MEKKIKAMFVNGGPRKNWNTAKMLESAMKGAQEAGAETELVHLYDIKFQGCKSCFACKIKNSKCNGVCALKDDLRPVLERARQADVLVFGSPRLLQLPHWHDARLHGEGDVPHRHLYVRIPRG